MADVIVTSPAGDDSDDILSYLQFHAGQGVADDYRLDLRAAFRRLAAFPESAAPGRPWGGAYG